MRPIEVEGNFRGRILSYGLNETDSGAIAVNIEVACEEFYHGGDEDYDAGWYEYDGEYSVIGRVWVVKKNGKLNKTSVESLMKNAGWDGSFESVVNETWHPEPVSVVVNRDEYNGRVRYVASWVNHFDNVPGGGLGNVSGDKAQDLQRRFGGELRAIAGNSQKPQGKPSKPGKQQSDTKPEKAGVAADDNIPF